jgi:hypothetical protein
MPGILHNKVPNSFVCSSLSPHLSTMLSAFDAETAATASVLKSLLKPCGLMKVLDPDLAPASSFLSVHCKAAVPPAGRNFNDTSTLRLCSRHR